MSKEYFTENISDETIVKMIDKALKFEKSVKNRNIKINLLKIVPAVVVIAFAIGLTNIFPSIYTNIGETSKEINPSTGIINEQTESITEYEYPGEDFIDTLDVLFYDNDGNINLDGIDGISEDTGKNIQAYIDKESKDIQSKIHGLLEATESLGEYVGGEMIWALDTEKGMKISSGFGGRINPITKLYEFHCGFDMPAPYDSNIYAVNDGTVLIAEYSKVYGNYIVIEHGSGKTTLYGQASSLLKKAGEKVEKGDIIAKVGSTGVSWGNHLHLEYAENGNPCREWKFEE